ncbi:tail fiber protein [Caudoviricetes sp.]|nr:tail fiber protein [Caudoviricetes sp.]
MTVSTDNKSARYEGNGVTDTFAFNGRIFTTNDLAVDILTRATDAVVETLASSDYTVSIISDESAEIVVDAGKIPSASQDILIYRSIDREQSLRLPTGTVFPAKDVEDALDKATILIQDVASDVDRVLKFPLNVSGITAAELPAPVDGMILTWDGTTGTIGNTDIADVSGELDGVFTSLVDGDYIVYDGTNWVNEHKGALPADGIQATGSAGLALKNSGGTAVLNVGAGAGTGATFAGGVNVSGAVSTTGHLTVTGTSSSPAYITLAEDTDNGTNKVTMIAPDTIASDYTITLPSSAGTLALTSDINTAKINILTSQATTSGAAFDFTIPSGVKRVKLMLYQVSLSGTDNLLVQIGTGGTPDTSGYSGAATTATSGTTTTNLSSGFTIPTLLAAQIHSGCMTLDLLDEAQNIWVCSGIFGDNSGARSFYVGGAKQLSGSIDIIRLTRAGTNTFDNGIVGASYEY